MSTTLDRRKAKKKNYADFDEYISFQLRKTQTGIRSTDIFTALCGAAVFVISYLLVFVVLDHWVVTGGFGNVMRAVLLVGLLLGTLAWIGWKVVWPFFRRVNSLYAAKALEESSPELKSTLLNYVDLQSVNREVAPAIIGSMEKRAAVTLSHAEVDDAIDRSTLLRLSYALLAAVVLFSVYSVVSPKKVWPSIVRIFAPGSDVSVSTQTAFLSVDPGDTKVLAREFLTVTADLSGEAPEEVTLLYTTADQQFVDEAVTMREVEAGLKRYRCILKGNGGEGLLQGLSYRIIAGDASTKAYNVTVAQPPSATVNELRYSFPDYMELPPERPTGSNIDTWEGTTIEIAATTNMIVESAKLQFSDEAEFPARCEEIRMKVDGDGTGVTGLWQPIIREDGTYPKFYRVQCRTKDGAADPAPAVHSIQVRPDEKPEISTLQPRGDKEVAVNATVPLLIDASDADFRLSRVVLQMKNGARALTPRVIYKGADVEQRVLHELEIAGLNAQPGDVITWWAEAHDNRRVETASRTLLDANRSLTPRLKFIVQAPVSEEEAKEQLGRDKERAQEKLDERDQRVVSGDLSSDESSNEMPKRESDPEEDPSANADNKKPDSDEPEPQENSRNEQNSDEGKAGGKGGNDSESNNDGGKETSDETGKSGSDQSKPGQSGSDSGNSDGDPNQDGSKGASGSQKPVSNDGSQDDEILKELLNRNRDSKPDGAKGDGDKQDGDKQPSGNRPEDERSDSPESKTGDKEPGDESSKPEGDTAKGGGNPDEPGEESANEKSGSDAPEKGTPSDNEKQPGEGNAPKKGDEKSGSSDSQKSTEVGNDPSTKGESGEVESGNTPGDPQQSDDGSAGQNKGGSGEEKPGNAAGMPKSDTPKAGESTDGDAGSEGDSAAKPSDDPAGGGESGNSGKNGDGDGGAPSQSGPSSKSGQPGRDGSAGQAGDASDSSSSDQGSSGQPSSKNGSKGGSGEKSSDQSPGGDASKSASQNSEKPDGDSSADKSAGENSGDGSSSDSKNSDGSQPGKPSGSQPGEKPGNESSAKGDAKKSDGADGGESGKGDSPGKAGGKPGKGGSGGSEINNGSPGSGKSNATGGKPGQSTGSKPSNSSDPGGEAVASPDDNANPQEAVQRPSSGANPVDANLKDADEVNLEDKLKASNMVLKRLKKELDRGDVDPELLKKLGWTEKDMQRFAERLERQLAQPKPDDPAAEARRRQFEEVLRNVDLESSGRQQGGDFSNQKSTNNFSERRLPAPRSHRKAYEDYLKRLSQQRRRAGAGDARK